MSQECLTHYYYTLIHNNIHAVIDTSIHLWSNSVRYDHCVLGGCLAAWNCIFLISRFIVVWRNWGFMNHCFAVYIKVGFVLLWWYWLKIMNWMTFNNKTTVMKINNICIVFYEYIFSFSKHSCVSIKFTVSVLVFLNTKMLFATII